MKSHHNQWHMRLLLFITLISTCTNAAIAKETNEITLISAKENADWVTTNLDLEINLLDNTPTYSGVISLTLEGDKSFGPMLLLNNREVSMTDLAFDLLNAEQLPKYKLSIAGKNPSERPSTLSFIEFEKELQKGTILKLSFTYKFSKEQGQVFTRPAEDFENWIPLHYASWVTGWYPYPISNTDSLISVERLTSTGKTTFILSEKLHALSNGAMLSNKVDRGIRTQVWQVNNALARSYIAGPYNVSTVDLGDVDVSMFMLSPDKKAVEAKATLISAVISRLESSFGDYPYDTFALAEIPDKTTDYFGASSEQGFIVAESFNFKKGNGLALFSHEAGHSWWGNKFSCEGPGSTLCSEALAQLGSVISIEAVHGNAAMQDFLDTSSPDYVVSQSARGYFAFWRLGMAEPLATLTDLTKVHKLMDSKGMWFWQMLRTKLGNEKFSDVLKRLIENEKSLTLTELEQFFSEKTGQDLKYFFDQWLTRVGAPSIHLEWQVVNSMSKSDDLDFEVESFLLDNPDVQPTQKITVTLDQDPEDIYSLDPEIEFQFYDGSSVRKSVNLTEVRQVYVFEFNGAIKNIVVDPDRKIFMWRPEYGLKPSAQSTE